MRIPFTYCITHLPSGKKYYGARWAENCNPSDLWTTYFTSSRHIKELILHDGKDNFIAEVRKIFSDVDSCREWERKVLQRLGVIHNDNWLNKNINGRFLPYGKQSKEHIERRISKIRGANNPWYGKPELNPFYGKKHSEETLAKMRGPKADTSNMTFRKNNSTKITCPHCGKEGQLTNMKRWHFDNCKHQSHKD